MASGDVVLSCNVNCSNQPQSLSYPRDTDPTHDNGSFDVVLAGSATGSSTSNVAGSSNSYTLSFRVHGDATGSSGLPASLGKAVFDSTKTYDVTIKEH